MPTPALARRPHLLRFGLAGIGTAVLLVAIASPAAAAPGVVIPLEPLEVALVNVPVENHSGTTMEYMADPAADVEPSVVQYGETLTVDLADELDAAAAVVEIALADGADADTLPDRTYSTDPGATDPLVVTVAGGNVLEIVLPADDGVAGPLATLRIAPVEADATLLGPEFTVVDPVIEYALDLSATAPTGTELSPQLLAFAQVPCALSSPTPCPVAVTAGTTFALDLTADSALRDLGLTDLAGTALVLQSIDDPTADPLPLVVDVSGSTATVALPAELAAGSYGLVLGQPTTSGVSIVLAELAVAAATPDAAPPAAAPSTQAVAVNAGLRSNTGVTAPVEDSTSPALAGGVGLLLLAGAGGVAVARRRRPAAGSGEA